MSEEMKWGQLFILDGIDYNAVSVMRKRLSGLQKNGRSLSAEIERLKKRMQPSQG